MLVEQDVNMTLALADSADVLQAGRITLDGQPKDLREHPDVRAAYLGQAVTA